MNEPSLFDADWVDRTPLQGRTLIVSFSVEVAQPKERHRTGRGRTYTPTRTVNAEKDIRAAFLDAARGHEPDKARYALVIAVTGAHHSADVDNLAKCVMDGLEGSAYVNDRQVDELAVRRIRGRREKRTEITLYRIEEALVARQAARILVEIWADPDFRALDQDPQFRFLFLLSQPDLDHTGLISLRDRRWAKASADATAKRVMAELDALAAARFVVVDEDHEELLIRSFMRRDQVYRQPNILRSAVRQLASMSSPVLRAVLAVEVDRLAAADDIPEGSLEPLAEMRDALAEDAANPSNVIALVAGQGHREPKPEGYGEGFPEPFGDGYALTSGDGDGKDVGLGGVGGPGEGATFDDFWAVYPRKVEKKSARAKWDAAVKRAAAADIIAGAERYRDDPNRTPKYTKHPTTWLNGDCWGDEPIPGSTLVPVSSAESVTDQRVAGWMQLGAEMGAAS